MPSIPLSRDVPAWVHAGTCQQRIAIPFVLALAAIQHFQLWLGSPKSFSDRTVRAYFPLAPCFVYSSSPNPVFPPCELWWQFVQLARLHPLAHKLLWACRRPMHCFQYNPAYAILQ